MTSDGKTASGNYGGVVVPLSTTRRMNTGRFTGLLPADYPMAARSAAEISVVVWVFWINVPNKGKTTSSRIIIEQ